MLNSVSTDTPGLGTRSRLSPEDRRRQLLGIGLRMLVDKPIQDLSLDAVAGEAGISRSLLFHYFPTKTDYYDAVIGAAVRRVLRNIAPEQLRMHLCWGNYEGPHHCDVPLADVIDIVFRARPSAIALEAANPRHAHEWQLFETVKLPEGKMLIPGVIESKSNFVEHPELVAQRIGRYASLVGRENVMAGSDCGYGTWVGQAAVDPDVVWAKFAAMAEGARIASSRFWKR